MKKTSCDICIIGGGSGGLSLASGAAQLGKKVVLIECNKMGGDCLNVGCVPSKAFIAAAHVAKNHTVGNKFGVTPDKPKVSIAKVQKHVADVIAQIAPHDSVERFESLGVKVLLGYGRFKDSSNIEVVDKNNKLKHTVHFKNAVIATGSRASIPPIPGLIEAKPLTNETIFDLKQQPKHLLVIGGGPIGCELAQSWLRLGSAVTLFEALPRILSKDDEECTNIVKQRLISEGMTILEGVKIDKVSAKNKNVRITISSKGKTKVISGDALLVAAGRKPNLENLQLENAGISYIRQGIETNLQLKTSNNKVFAIGDINIKSLAFTHVAGYQAGLLVRNLLFKMRSKYSTTAIPWCTYTDPELSHVGISAEVAIKSSQYKILTLDWHLNDRARAERHDKSLIKVVADKKGFVHGATLVGPHAGEHILIWVMMIQQKIKLSTLAGLIAPYPTLSEAHKQIAGSFYKEALFSKKTKKLIKAISWLPW